MIGLAGVEPSPKKPQASISLPPLVVQLIMTSQLIAIFFQLGLSYFCMSLRGCLFEVMDGEAQLSCPGELLQSLYLSLSWSAKIVILTVTVSYAEVHRK